MLAIKQKPCDQRNYRTPRKGFINYIVLHYTAGNGDTDEQNGNYFAGRDTNDTSAHYFVDEDSITQSVSDLACAFHCGGTTYKHPECRNDNAIGIEMCSDKDASGNYIITEDTVNNAVELTKYLMRLYSIKTDHVLRHYDVTGKSCPAPWVTNESLWLDFKKRLEAAPMPDQWKNDIMVEAQKEGLINGDHKPDDPASKWFVLAAGLALLKKMRGGK